MMDADWNAKHAPPLLLSPAWAHWPKRSSRRMRSCEQASRKPGPEARPWEHIGKVLGVTRQAAWERFGSGELQQNLAPLTDSG